MTFELNDSPNDSPNRESIMTKINLLIAIVMSSLHEDYQKK